MASSPARVLSVALVVLADDQGRGRLIPAVMAARVFPREPDAFNQAMDELSRLRFVISYRVGDQRYWQIRNWDKHQRVDKPSKPRIPSVSDGVEENFGSARESQEFSLGIPGSSRLTPTPTSTPTSTNDPDQYPVSGKQKTGSSPVAQIRKAFLDGYAARFPNAHPYPWGKRENGQAKNLLGSVPLERVLELIPMWFAWPNKRAIDAMLTFGTGHDCFVMKHHELAGDVAHPERRVESAIVADRFKQQDNKSAQDGQAERIAARYIEEHYGKNIDPTRSASIGQSNRGSRALPQPQAERGSERALAQDFDPVLRGGFGGGNAGSKKREDDAQPGFDFGGATGNAREEEGDSCYQADDGRGEEPL